MKTYDQPGSNTPTNHFANERTYLAWMRTSMAIMGLGFVDVKFGLFFMERTRDFTPSGKRLPSAMYSTDLGVALIGVGILTGGYAYHSYRCRERQLRLECFTPTPLPAMYLTAAIGHRLLPV